MDDEASKAHNERMGPAVQKSLLRRSFDRAERLVGAPLEDFVHTRQFADAMVVAFKLQTGSRRVVESSTRTLLHLWNIPTRSDVMRVSRQIAVLENSVRSMALALDRDDLAARKVSEDGVQKPGNAGDHGS